MTRPRTSPRVSVVIPAYNGGRLLRRAVESVIGQTFTDWECLVIDDGGEEDLGWVERIDPRVRLVRQANAGVSRARNRGAAMATAPFLAFCDQDDAWLPEKLQAQVEAWSPGTACSITDFSWEFADGRSEDAHHPEAPSWLSMVRGGHMCLSSLMVDAAAFWSVGGFDPVLAVEQDWLLFVQLLQRYPGAVRVVPTVMVRYHLHGSNGSSDYFRAYRERKAVLDRLAARADREVKDACREGHALNRRLRSMQAIEVARQARRKGDMGTVMVSMSRALRWSPRVAIAAIRTAL